jgi:protocatechuate 3,4-dioxygenase alpha subunit
MNRSTAEHVASPSQTVGPFFHFALTSDAALAQLIAPESSGDRIRLRIRVLDGGGAPVSDAMVELWQADAEGRYSSTPSFRGWGRGATDDRGECAFDTVRPGAASNGASAAHINVCLFMRGMLRHLFTRIYFAGDAALARDAALAIVPVSRRETLVARHIAGEWLFEIRLQGDAETVFFDL